jgi:hypothetical protein
MAQTFPLHDGVPVENELMDQNKSGLLLHDDNRRPAHVRQSKMAFNKPVRWLAAACMALFFFLMLQIMRSPNPMTPPGSKEKTDYASFARDPNLDGRTSCAQSS